MEENKTKNINFFKKVAYSITKFEKYPDMATEGLGNALKYVIILMAILTVFLTIGSLIDIIENVKSLSIYIQDNIPEFTYADGKIEMETEESIKIDDVKSTGIDHIIIEPDIEEKEEKEKVKDENNTGTTVYFFKDQIILKVISENGKIQTQEYTYKDFIKSYTNEDIKQFNKAELIDYLNSTKMNYFYSKYSLSLVMYLILMNVLVTLLDILKLAILGWITSITAKVKMRFLAIYNMAAYSLTLPILLNILYVIINYFTDFTIQYFSVAYITIAYIYLAATIFILKDDFLKKQEEVEKIKKEQEKVREEIKEQEKEKEEKKKKRKKEKEEKDEEEDNNQEEPKGSEA